MCTVVGILVIIIIVVAAIEACYLYPAEQCFEEGIRYIGQGNCTYPKWCKLGQLSVKELPYVQSFCLQNAIPRCTHKPNKSCKPAQPSMWRSARFGGLRKKRLQLLGAGLVLAARFHNSQILHPSLEYLFWSCTRKTLF